MFLVTLRLRTQAPPQQTAADEVGEAFWRAAWSTDGLEHVYAAASPVGIDVALFLVADRRRSAEQSATALAVRAISDPRLAVWHTTQGEIELSIETARPMEQEVAPVSAVRKVVPEPARMGETDGGGA